MDAWNPKVDKQGKLHWIKVKKIEWSTVFLGTMASCMVLQLFINVALVGMTSSMKDQGAEFKRGKLYAQSDAYRFIKKSDRKLADKYYKFLEVSTWQK